MVALDGSNPSESAPSDGSNPSAASDRSQWMRMLDDIEAELTSRGGSAQLVNRVRAELAWSEYERKELRQNTHESVQKLQQLNEMMRRLKTKIQEGLNVREELTNKVDEQSQALKDARMQLELKEAELIRCHAELARYKR
jgi:chromosome segregation ATPase